MRVTAAAPTAGATTTSNNQVNWGGKPRASFYSANYINWYYGGGAGSRATRLDIVKDVATTWSTPCKG